MSTKTKESTMALVGVRRCGCITACQIEGYADAREMASFYTDMADTDRRVERVVFDEVKKLPTFLSCEHAAVSGNEEETGC